MEIHDQERDWETAQGNLRGIWGVLQSIGITRDDGRQIAYDFFLWSQSRPPLFEKHRAAFLEFLRGWFTERVHPLPDHGIRQKMFDLFMSNPFLLPKRIIKGHPLMPVSFDGGTIDFESLYQEFTLESDPETPLRKECPPQFQKEGTKFEIVSGLRSIQAGCKVRLCSPLKHGKEIDLELEESGHVVHVFGVIAKFTALSWNEVNVTTVGRFTQDGTSLGSDTLELVFRLRGSGGNGPSIDDPTPRGDSSLPITDPVLAS